MDPDVQEKAAFMARGSRWTWKILPFGLISAPATFEHPMEMVIKSLQWKTLLLYLDYVIAFSSNFGSHVVHLEEVLQGFRTAGLKLKPSKCELFRTEVRYQGHLVSERRVATDPDKVVAIK